MDFSQKIFIEKNMKLIIEPSVVICFNLNQHSHVLNLISRLKFILKIRCK